MKSKCKHDWYVSTDAKVNRFSHETEEKIFFYSMILSLIAAPIISFGCIPDLRAFALMPIMLGVVPLCVACVLTFAHETFGTRTVYDKACHLCGEVDLAATLANKRARDRERAFENKSKLARQLLATARKDVL